MRQDLLVFGAEEHSTVGNAGALITRSAVTGHGGASTLWLL